MSCKILFVVLFSVFFRCFSSAQTLDSTSNNLNNKANGEDVVSKLLQQNEKSLTDEEILAAQKLLNNSKYPVLENEKAIEQATQHRNKIVSRYLREGDVEKARRMLLMSEDSSKISNRLLQFLWKKALVDVDEKAKGLATSYYYSSWILALENKLMASVQAAENALKAAEEEQNQLILEKSHLLLSNLYAEMGLAQLSIYHTEQLNTLLQDKKGGLGIAQFFKNNLALLISIGITLLTLLLLGYFLIYRGSKSKSERIKKENKNLNGELLKSNQLKDKLFAVLAHDLKAPVNSLTGLLDVINSDLVDENRKKEMFKKLKIELSNSSTMLNNLLGWAKGQMVNPQPKIESINVKELFDGNIQLLKSFAEAKGVILKNGITENIQANGDKEMMNIIVRNLVQNAIKYTDNGDKIILDTDYDDTKKEIRIKVTDTGKGMTEEKLNKLFDLESLSEPGTRNETGSGLGLILCKEFAEAQGGRMWAESKEGYGSVFYLALKSAS